MHKTISLGDLWRAPWPAPESIAHFFLDPSDRSWAYWDSGTGAVIAIDEMSTAKSDSKSNVCLFISADRRAGVTLFHRRWDGLHSKQTGHYSRGDLARRCEFIKTRDGEYLSKGLFISFEAAWHAVEDFMKGEGALSNRVDWINAADLPADTFPDP